MEWMISAAIVIGVIVLIISFTIEKDNYHFYFRDMNLAEKIARVVVSIFFISLVLGILLVLIYCVKELVFE